MAQVARPKEIWRETFEGKELMHHIAIGTVRHFGKDIAIPIQLGVEDTLVPGGVEPGQNGNG